MANALTAVRLALVLPICRRLRPSRTAGAGVVALLLGLAIATDYLDGPSRDERGRHRPGASCSTTARTASSSPGGLTGAAIAGAVTPTPAGLDTARLWPVRRRFLRVASPAAAACQFSRALERHPLFRAPRAHRGGSRLPSPGGLSRRPAAGGRRARVRAAGVDALHDRSRDDAVRSSVGSGFSRTTGPPEADAACTVRNRIESRAGRAAGRASGCAHGSSGCPGSPVSAGRRRYCRCSGD